MRSRLDFGLPLELPQRMFGKGELTHRGYYEIQRRRRRRIVDGSRRIGKIDAPRFTRVNVYGIIACSVVCDPFDALWETIDYLLVESPNLCCRFVFSVYPDDAVIFSSRTARFEERWAIGRVHVLGSMS